METKEYNKRHNEAMQNQLKYFCPLIKDKCKSDCICFMEPIDNSYAGQISSIKNAYCCYNFTGEE